MKIILSKEGFGDILLVKDSEGYKTLAYVDNYGGKRFEKVGVTDKEVIQNIIKYGTHKKSFKISQGASSQVGKVIRI